MLPKSRAVVLALRAMSLWGAIADSTQQQSAGLTLPFAALARSVDLQSACIQTIRSMVA